MQGLEKRATARKTGTAKGAATARRKRAWRTTASGSDRTGSSSARVVHHATVARLEGLVASPEALRRALRREDMRSAAASRIHCSARGCSRTREAGGGGHGAGRGDVHARRVLDLVAASLSFAYFSPSYFPLSPTDNGRHRFSVPVGTKPTHLKKCS